MKKLSPSLAPKRDAGRWGSAEPPILPQEAKTFLLPRACLFSIGCAWMHGRMAGWKHAHVYDAYRRHGWSPAVFWPPGLPSGPHAPAGPHDLQGAGAGGRFPARPRPPHLPRRRGPAPNPATHTCCTMGVQQPSTSCIPPSLAGRGTCAAVWSAAARAAQLIVGEAPPAAAL